MKRKVNRFSDELALKIALEYLTTDANYEYLQEKYNFTGNGNITRWIRKFGLSKPIDQETIQTRAMKSEPQRTRREKELEKDLEKLKQELEYEKLRVRAYEKLIDVAETNLKISIRKKPGTKQ